MLVSNQTALADVDSIGGRRVLMSMDRSLRWLFVLCVVSSLVETGTAQAAKDSGEGQADKAAQPEKTIATQWARIEIKGAYPEGASMPGLFGAASENLATITNRLERAAADDELAGVLLRINGPSLGWAKLNELRIAVGEIRKQGRKVIALMDDAGTQDYLLACACDEIIMPESGSLMVLGLRAEVTFYRNLFEKIGVKADMLQVGEYKGAAEPYTRTEMSPAYREEMEAILDDYFDQIVDTIATDRKMDRDKVIAAIDNGPHTATAAKELGLINRLAYDDEVKKVLADEFGGKTITSGYGKKKIDTDFSGFAGMMKMMNLLLGVEQGGRRAAGDRVAVIHATGIIMSGRSVDDPLGGKILGSDTIIKAVQKAERDDSVKAIVLRVDSPGGSALASDLMWRALKNCKKPVVTSMGNTAASGGYYIAMGTDAVFAEPGTLTGSIGVVGGKLTLGGVFDKIGITTSVIKRGKNSGVLSSLSVFSDSEREAMKKLMADVYRQFTGKVADARKMTPEKVEELARGRVYTGRMAHKLKLVDELGTLDDAVAHAQKLAGLDPKAKLDRLVLPRATSPFEALFGPLDPEARIPANGAVAAALKSLSPELARELRAAAVMQLLSKERRLTILPYRLKIE